MADWNIARDPGVRLRDIAARTGVTERTAHGIATDLTEAGYVVKHKDGRRYRYQIQAHLPLPEPGTLILRDGQEAGEIRSGRGDLALALLRLEMMEAAAKSGAPLLAGEARVRPIKPDWAKF